MGPGRVAGSGAKTHPAMMTGGDAGQWTVDERSFALVGIGGHEDELKLHQNWGSRLTLKVASDGSAEGSGYDNSDNGKLNFTLKNARIDGAKRGITK